MDEVKKLKTVRVLLDGREKTYFYFGRILDEDSEFILFNDQKSGLLRLNKFKILSIQEVQQ